MSNAVGRYALGADTFTIVDPRFGTGEAPAQPIGWGGGGGGEGGPTHVRYIPPSGDTTGNLDAQNINDALLAAKDATPSVVYLDGEYYVNTPIEVQTGTTLQGSGWRNATIHLTAGANCDVVTAPTAYRFRILDLAIDGHSESQTLTGNSAGCGVNIASQPNPYPDLEGWRGGSLHIIQGVYTHYTVSDGIRIDGYSNEGRLINCYAVRAGRNGFRITAGVDYFAMGLTSGESYSDGIRFEGDGRLLWCKSWWSGITAPRGQNPRLSTVTNPAACGYHFPGGVSGTGAQVFNCEAQDSGGYSFNIEASWGRYYIKTDQPAGGHVNVTGKGNVLDLHYANITHGTNAPYMIVGLGSQNTIRLHGWTRHAASGTGTQRVMNPAINPLDAVRNTVTSDTSLLQLPTTYAATVEPDFAAGSPAITLTGDITISNPLDDLYGAEAEVLLTQDATGGHTVTWGEKFTNMSAITAAAGKTTVWRIRCIGHVWRQVDHYTL